MARPRSALAHQKVLEASIGLFAERGIDSTSMDAICEASGVSKATLYKHWPDKDALCMEVLTHLHGLDEAMPEFDSGDIRADLIAQLRYEPAADRREMRSRLLPHLMAYAARHREFGDQWRLRVIERPRKQLRRILERGIRDGALSPDTDIEVGMALLLGPMLYRKIFASGFGANLPKDFDRHVVDAFWAKYARKRRAARRRVTNT